VVGNGGGVGGVRPLPGHVARGGKARSGCHPLAGAGVAPCAEWKPSCAAVCGGACVARALSAAVRVCAQSAVWVCGGAGVCPERLLCVRTARSAVTRPSVSSTPRCDATSA